MGPRVLFLFICVKELLLESSEFIVDLEENEGVVLRLFNSDALDPFVAGRLPEDTVVLNFRAIMTASNLSFMLDVLEFVLVS